MGELQKWVNAMVVRKKKRVKEFVGRKQSSVKSQK